jgi:hypothetical protein
MGGVDDALSVCAVAIFAMLSFDPEQTYDSEMT